LSRHRAVSLSVLSPRRSRQRFAAEAKSNSVPYASNTHALTPFSRPSLCRGPLMHASDQTQWAGTSSHGASNPAYAMYCQQRALPASVSHAVPASANAQEIRFGKMLVARRPQIEALLKRGCHALSQPARCSPASLGVREIAGPCGTSRAGRPTGRCRTARLCRSAGPLRPARTRRTSGRGGIAGSCRSARSARRSRTAGTSRPEGRRGTGRTQGRSQ
jgi:hypothetical protein